MNEINNRFASVIQDIKNRQMLSVNAIEREAGLTKIISNIIGKGSEPSAATIAAITKRFPSYSAEWIVNGRGNMFYNSEVAELQQRYQRLLELNSRLQEKLNQ